MILKTENITKKFDSKTVLENVSLTFEQGHSYALLGRNGMGKSTLINVIMQRTAFKGKITIDGVNIKDNDMLMQSLFCMNDNSFYPPWMKLRTVFELTDALYLDFDMDYAKNLAEDFDIDLKKRINQLSTGQRTLYKVILGLSSNAPFVFLDEPVLGIDVNMRDTVYRILTHKMAEERSCFVICTHLIEEIENLIENVVILHDQHIIANMTAEQMYERYRAFSGKAEDVNIYASELNVIGMEKMAGFRKIVIDTAGRDFTAPAELTEDHAGIQEIFYHLTGGAPEVRA